MPRFEPPTTRVLCLADCIGRPGHIVRPGEVIDVPNHVANTLISMGKARLLTAEDQAPQKIVARDPLPIHRDPIPNSRSKRK